MTRIRVQQPADHPLVLCAVLCGFLFEEFDAPLRERDRHLYAFLAKSELSRGRQKVGNNLQAAQRLIGVSDFLGHRFVCLFANSQHQRFELRPRDR